MKKLLLATTMLLALASGAQAAQVTVTAISGSWGTIVGGQSVGIVAGDPTTVHWGTGSPQSGYKFDANPVPIVGITVGSGEFDMGTFTHINNPIGSGTSITSAILSIDITFTSDLFVGSKNAHSEFKFNHNETPNQGGNNCCPDIVTAGFVNLGSSLFNFGGVDYTFGITGFKVGLNQFAQFTTIEGQDNNAILRASFAGVETFNVPGPLVGAFLPTALAAFGLFGVNYFRRRRLTA